MSAPKYIIANIINPTTTDKSRDILMTFLASLNLPSANLSDSIFESAVGNEYDDNIRNKEYTLYQP